MIHLKIKKVAYIVFLFTLVFNQQVNNMSMFKPMNQDMMMEQKSISHLENDDLSECHTKICFEMCKLSTILAIDKSIKFNPNPIYISSILNVDYNFSNNEVNLDPLYRPPQTIQI